jgi:hypothetical protein
MDGTWSQVRYKKTARIVQISSKRPTENTERKFWEPPNKMRKMDPASGEYGTTPGARHFLRDYTWITVSEVNQQVYPRKYGNKQ